MNGFRVYDKKEKCYPKGLGIFLLDCDGDLKIRDENEEHYSYADPNRYVVEFSTGRNDVDEKEMFIGDVFSVNGKHPKLFRYSETGKNICVVNIEDIKRGCEKWMHIEQFPSELWWDDFKREIKIIGTIHNYWRSE